MRVLAPAKVNLHLRVGPARADGFHPLLTWMCTAGLFDTLTFVRGARRRSGEPESSSDAAAAANGPADLSAREAASAATAADASAAGAGSTPSGANAARARARAAANATGASGATRATGALGTISATSATAAAHASDAPHAADAAHAADVPHAAPPTHVPEVPDGPMPGHAIGAPHAADLQYAGAADARQWFLLTADHPTLPTDGRNLVVKVAAALADTLSRVGEGSTDRQPPEWRAPRVSAYLIKRIPAGAGLGGGSSDAAATLKALAAIWKLDWSAARLGEFAARFGSDVTFFFHGPSSVCTGRGEIVRPIAAPAARHAVLVLPELEMPTPAVYRRFDEMRLGRAEDIVTEPDWAAWARLSAKELMPRLVNDLEPPAFSLRPELGELRAKLERTWVRQVRMSGSGSALFTLCDTGEEAEETAAAARAAYSVTALPVRLAPAEDMSAAGAG